MKVSHVAELYNLIIPRKTCDSIIPRMKSKENKENWPKTIQKKNIFYIENCRKILRFFENIYEGVIVFIITSTSVVWFGTLTGSALTP